METTMEAETVIIYGRGADAKQKVNQLVAESFAVSNCVSGWLGRDRMSVVL